MDRDLDRTYGIAFAHYVHCTRCGARSGDPCTSPYRHGHTQRPDTWSSCPHCGADPGDQCVSTRAPHRERVNFAATFAN